MLERWFISIINIYASEINSYVCIFYHTKLVMLVWSLKGVLNRANKSSMDHPSLRHNAGDRFYRIKSVIACKTHSFLCLPHTARTGDLRCPVRGVKWCLQLICLRTIRCNMTWRVVTVLARQVSVKWPCSSAAKEFVPFLVAVWRI